MIRYAREKFCKGENYMKMLIRKEQAKEHRHVEEMTKRAFWNLYYPGGDEHYLTHIIRKHKDYLDDLSFVAVVDDIVVGNIMYTQSYIEGNSGEKYKVATFGPICVEPAYQNKGIGRQLINHTIKLATQQQYDAIAILGFPHVYTRYGFKNGTRFDIHMGDNICPAGLLVLPLKDSQDLSGQIYFSDVFNINAKDVDAFDEDFFQLPKKEEYWHEDFYIMFNAIVQKD